MKRPFRRSRLLRWLSGSKNHDAELFGLIDDDRAELLYEANRFLKDGKVDEAKQLFQLAIQYFSDAGEPWIGWGACLQHRGFFEEAKRTYEVGLNINPGEPHALANVAECCLLLGQIQGAKKALGSIPAETRAKLPEDLAKRIRELETFAENPPEASAASGTNAKAILYSLEPELDREEFLSVLERSTLAERRPVNELGTIDRMLQNAGVIVTARKADQLIGVSRAITDFAYCTYLSDLAVDRDYQKQGIGRELIRRTHEAAGLQTTLILLAAPMAREYYPHLGMTPHDSCWIIPRIPPSSGSESAP